MVKIFTCRHLFELPWSSVTNAWLQKYPNPLSLHIDEVDTIDRRIDEKTGAFIIRRLVSSSLSPPKWMEAIGFPAHAYILEEAIINPFTKEMVLRSINITGNHLIEIEEICTYSEQSQPHPPSEDDNIESEQKAKGHRKVTNYEQKAIIESPVPLLHAPIETASLTIFSHNASKGLSAMQQICCDFESVGSEGFTKVLQWRLDTILLLNELDSLKEINLKELGINTGMWSSKK